MVKYDNKSWFEMISVYILIYVYMYIGCKCMWLYMNMYNTASRSWNHLFGGYVQGLWISKLQRDPVRSSGRQLCWDIRLTHPGWANKTKKNTCFMVVTPSWCLVLKSISNKSRGFRHLRNSAIRLSGKRFTHIYNGYESE